MRRVIRDNGLGLAFGGLFLASLVGQAFAGLAQFNAQRVGEGSEPVSLLNYLTSSSFAVAVTTPLKTHTGVLSTLVPGVSAAMSDGSLSSP